MNEILKISGYIDEDKMEKLIKSLKARNLNEVLNIFNSIEMFDSRNFIRQLSMNLPKFSDELARSSEIRAFFGEIDYRISQGADERIQIMALFAKIIENI